MPANAVGVWGCPASRVLLLSILEMWVMFSFAEVAVSLPRRPVSFMLCPLVERSWLGCCLAGLAVGCPKGEGLELLMG